MPNIPMETATAPTATATGGAPCPMAMAIGMAMAMALAEEMATMGTEMATAPETATRATAMAMADEGPPVNIVPATPQGSQETTQPTVVPIIPPLAVADATLASASTEDPMTVTLPLC